MGVSEKAMFIFLTMAVNGFSMGFGAVYKVGDSAGWTANGNVDYRSWASSKHFKVGDSIRFEYDPRDDNVSQVTRKNFHLCNSTSPISTFSTGNDTITFTSSGHYYYITGTIDHCNTGQKVDIRVLKPTISPVEPPTHSMGPSHGPTASSPSHNGAVALHNFGLIFVIVGLCVSDLMGIFELAHELVSLACIISGFSMYRHEL